MYAIVLGCSGPTADQVGGSTIEAPDRLEPVRVDLRTWLGPAKDGLLRTDSIMIENDFLFKTTKNYQAIPLRLVLDSVLSAYSDPYGTGTIKLVCKDGYAPTHRLSDLPLSFGWLAYRDLEAEAGAYWVGEKAESYGPFYLVWNQPDLDPKAVSWPWGLDQLEITFEDPHASITPQGDEPALQGLRLYEQYCIKCHSINKVGGLVGPELNFPKSITEYLEKEIIWQYIKNPRSFRYNSKMHGTEDLTREEFELVYRYLLYMKDKRPAS